MAKDDPGRPRRPEERPPSRRGFLKAAGVAAAGAGVGAAASLAGSAAVHRAHEDEAGGASGLSGIPPRLKGPGFDHLVVVMFENRSFDTLLGHLYSPEHGGAPLPFGASFEGVQGKDLSNRAPDGSVVKVHAYSGDTDRIMRSPDPDPGEEYPYVNTQLFDRVDPASNAGSRVPDLQPPYNAPDREQTAAMSGFVRDYVQKWRAENGGADPTPEQYRQILGVFTPPMLPVFSTLAREFAVYDHWHCAVPSQTFPNRSFFHASTSHGFVTNAFDPDITKWLDPEQNRGPTIFNRLEDAGISWAVYYDDRQLISLTGLLHAPQLEKYWRTRFRTMSHFYRDAADGTLPAYCFIEPRLVYDHNDMHPPVGPMTRTTIDGTVIEGGAISDVRAGDSLLHRIYTAIRDSSSTSGSNAMNTTLLVTFDEHGGTYDHVPPPAATPPELSDETEMDFRFDRLGVRVPAIVVSAYTAKNTIVSDQMHHGSLIATLCARHGLRPLTERDKNATSIHSAINLGTPRDPATWPTTFPLYSPPNPEAKDPEQGKDDDHRLSPPGVGLLALLMAKYAPDEPVPQTYAQAWAAIHKHGMGLFGT